MAGQDEVIIKFLGEEAQLDAVAAKVEARVRRVSQVAASVPLTQGEMDSGFMDGMTRSAKQQADAMGILEGRSLSARHAIHLVAGASGESGQKMMMGYYAITMLGMGAGLAVTVFISLKEAWDRASAASKQLAADLAPLNAMLQDAARYSGQAGGYRSNTAAGSEAEGKYKELLAKQEDYYKKSREMDDRNPINNLISWVSTGQTLREMAAEEEAAGNKLNAPMVTMTAQIDRQSRLRSQLLGIEHEEFNLHAGADQYERKRSGYLEQQLALQQKAVAATAVTLGRTPAHSKEREDTEALLRQQQQAAQSTAEAIAETQRSNATAIANLLNSPGVDASQEKQKLAAEDERYAKQRQEALGKDWISEQDSNGVSLKMNADHEANKAKIRREAANEHQNFLAGTAARIIGMDGNQYQAERGQLEVWLREQLEAHRTNAAEQAAIKAEGVAKGADIDRKEAAERRSFLSQMKIESLQMHGRDFEAERAQLEQHLADLREKHRGNQEELTRIEQYEAEKRQDIARREAKYKLDQQRQYEQEIVGASRGGDVLQRGLSELNDYQQKMDEATRKGESTALLKEAHEAKLQKLRRDAEKELRGEQRLGFTSGGAFWQQFSAGLNQDTDQRAHTDALKKLVAKIDEWLQALARNPHSTAGYGP